MSEIGWISLAALTLIWGGYPLLIRVLAIATSRRRRPPARGVRPPPFVSVILAAREPAEEVAERVADCLAGTYPGDRLEVVAVKDAGSVHLPPSSEDPRVRVIEGDRPGGKAAALNAGVRASRGEVLVFADVHQRFLPDAIERLVGALQCPGVGAVSGRLELPASEGTSLAQLYWGYERWLRENEASVHSCVGTTGAIWAMERRLWRPLPVELILDDVFTPMRLVLDGHRVGFVPAARARERRRTSARREYARKVRTLTGVIQLCIWLPAVLHPLRNPLWLQFVFHKLLRLSTPLLLLLILLSGAAMLLRAAAEAPLMAGVGLVPLGLVFGIYPKAGRRAATLLAEAAALQAAVVMAVANGVRKRWAVWK